MGSSKLLKCIRPPDPERRASKELEKKISQWMKEYNRAIKLLLLGAGESGKTTIIKQMKILHIKGFSESEKQEKAKDINSNILESITALARHMSILKPQISLEDQSNQPSLQYVLNIEPSNDFEYTQEFFDHVKKLWDDEGIRECYRRSNEFQLIDCAKYFLDRVDMVRKNNYIPSDQDILHSRRRTTDIQKIEFSISVPKKFGGGSQTFWMFDVGGQRGERKKWIQVFEGIQAILFLVSTSSFDQTIREDEETNRLKEALKLFEDVWNSRFLQGAGVIVFLNKQDVLKEKIESGISMGDYFPEYNQYEMDAQDGDYNDEYIKTRSFIKDKFVEVTQNDKPSDIRKLSLGPGFNISAEQVKVRGPYWHYTTATDTNNIRTVFNDVHTMIIMINLQKIGAQ